MNREEIDVSLSKEKIIDVLSADGHKIFVYCNRAGDQPSDKRLLSDMAWQGLPIVTCTSWRGTILMIAAMTFIGWPLLG